MKRNLKRCKTFKAFLVESALSLRPKTSWNNVSAVLLAPFKKRRQRSRLTAVLAKFNQKFVKLLIQIKHTSTMVSVYIRNVLA